VLFHDQLRDMVAAVTGLDPLNAAQMVRRFARHRPAELATLRREFMMFAVEWGTEMDVATHTFARILHSAGATVSRQQIIADALIVCAMLYLAMRHPIAYFVELANVHRGNESRRDAYLRRALETVPLLGVDINRSGLDYTVEDTGVRPPLWTVKGVGEESARRIVRARGTQKIRNSREFDCLIDDSGITYKIVEALVGAGALESVGIPADAEVPRREVKTPRSGSPRGHATNQLQFELGIPDPDAEDPSRS
jgi:DNA polymerase III alpha subunit